MAFLSKFETEPDCPECGEPMIRRTNRATGTEFWGCPDYPKCQGVRSGDDPEGGQAIDAELPSERQRGRDRGRFRSEGRD